ncbi:MAG: RHS repeat-associated core domain-containing protein, partial [Acidobacteria bacterium]|nr:RHS repeat-associated core domain-containing protein [Acidobacteriota bacterium]
YGEEPTVTAQDRDKFATYYRDGVTNLDYADQRYYSSQYGRFLTPDPYVASGGAADPGSWNRYAYVGGDPVNWIDRRGLDKKYPMCGPGGEKGSEEEDDMCYEPSPSYEPQKTAGANAGGGGASNFTPLEIATDLRVRVQDGDINDCEAMALFAGEIASQRWSETATDRQIAEAFSVFVPPNPGLGVQGTANWVRFGEQANTGYASGYADSLNARASQAHHVAFYFQLGFNYAMTDIASATAFAMAAEVRDSLTRNTAFNLGDALLGGAAAYIGGQFQAGAISRNQLHSAMRDLCDSPFVRRRQ